MDRVIVIVITLALVVCVFSIFFWGTLKLGQLARKSMVKATYSIDTGDDFYYTNKWEIREGRIYFKDTSGRDVMSNTYSVETLNGR